MDPNAALATARRVVTNHRNGEEIDCDPDTDALLELVDAFEALDEWITKGGFPPAAWTTETPSNALPDACDEFEGDGDYCTRCGWHDEGHGDMPCCADWCGLHVDHDGPCRER